MNHSFPLLLDIFPKFPDFFLTGKSRLIFPGFPVPVGTLNSIEMLQKTIHGNYLIKADTFQFSTDINARRADAEGAGFLKAVLCVHRPDSHSGGQRRRNHDGDDIQRPQYHFLYSRLKYKSNS